MDFIFQGFQSALPLWSYLLIFIGTSLLAWWSYRKVSGIKPIYRYLLTGLRALIFAILLLVLLNPLLKTEATYFEHPTIAVILDNSASTSLTKNGYKGKESYRNVLTTLGFRDSTSLNFKYFIVGSSTTPSSPDSLTFDAEQTNLSKVTQLLNANEMGANSAILISDGIYTQGKNPIYEAGNLEIPIFTVGLGDTASQKDILVRSVSTNTTGYIDTPQPVAVQISAEGFAKTPFEVQLRDGNKILESQTVTPDLTSFNNEITFNLTPKKEGLQQYSIVIPKLDKEWNGDNNSHRFSVDVEDARQNILSLAFEVHPDVKYLRSLLITDENTDLTTRTWLRGNRFIEGPFKVDPDSVDLAVIHGYPRSGLPQTVIQSLNELTGNVPFIVLATPLFAPNTFEQNITSLPIQISGPWRYSPVVPSRSEQSSSHPIMELPAIEYSQLPTLSAPITNIQQTGRSETLFTSVYQDNKTNNPLVAVQELGNRRIALLSGFGWFRYNQNSNPAIREFGRTLLLNLISWTATDPTNKLLTVKPSKTTYSGSENVLIDAFLKNERGQMEADAQIDLTIGSEQQKKRFYSMEYTGDGRYHIDLGTMPDGLYAFKATAEKEGRTIDSYNGEFAVAQSNAEFIDTKRNDRLLRQVAKRSGGTYLPYDSLSTFWQNLQQNQLLAKEQKTNISYFNLYKNIGWFLLVLFLLAGEWILRKYLSLP